MDNFALSFGESGGSPATPQEIEERLKILEEKVRRDAREIVEVLRVDFPRFIERVVKDRFVTSREFADRIGDSALQALKADVARTGKTAADELVPPLEEWGIWLELPGPVPPPAERRDLQANPEVQARLQRVSAYVRELLERHKFPDVRDEEANDMYRLPQWFIAGRLLVSLVESYWRNMEEFYGVRDALRSLKERDLRTKRGDRWDAV